MTLNLPRASSLHYDTVQHFPNNPSILSKYKRLRLVVYIYEIFTLHACTSSSSPAIRVYNKNSLVRGSFSGY